MIKLPSFICIVMYKNSISIIFASLVITSEWWFIYSCQGYLDHLSKAILLQKIFLISHHLKNHFFLMCTHNYTAIHIVLHLPREVMQNALFVHALGSQREKRGIPTLTLNQSYHHHDMIGKAEVFSGTDNYIITNKWTETN